MSPRSCEDVHALDVLGAPVRRRVLELLAEGEQSAGAVTAVVWGADLQEDP